MVVPLAARWVAAACGVLLLLTGWGSVIGTLIVPRPVGSWLTRWVDRVVIAAFGLVTAKIGDYERLDRVLTVQAPAILLTQLGAWLVAFFLGYGLLVWPFIAGGITWAFTISGSAMFTLGFAVPVGTAP